MCVSPAVHFSTLLYKNTSELVCLSVCKQCSDGLRLQVCCLFEVTGGDLLFSWGVSEGPCKNVICHRELIACSCCAQLHFSLRCCFYTRQLTGLSSSASNCPQSPCWYTAESNSPLICSYSHYKSPFFFFFLHSKSSNKTKKYFIVPTFRVLKL